MNVTLEPTRIKVTRRLLGHIFDMWVDGFYLVINGHRQYPPLPASEAKKSQALAIRRLSQSSKLQKA